MTVTDDDDTTDDDDVTTAHWLDDPQGADEDAQDEPGTTGDDDEADDSGDDDDEPQEDTGKKPGVRQRLKDAEADRDRLTAALDQTRQLILDRAVADSGVAENFRTALATVLKANGFEITDYCDENGVPDLEILAGGVGIALESSGLPLGGRAPRPNPVAGRTGGAAPPEKATFASVLREHVESSGIDRK